MFDDWDLLRRIDEELCEAAERHGINLPAWPVGNQGLWHVANARKAAIQQIMELEDPHPPSWRELAERLFANDWLDRFIRNQHFCREARDDETREGIAQEVKVRLYFVIISNAGKWYAIGDHARNWQGFIIRQVPQLAKRRSRDRRSPDRAEPRGDVGPDGFDPLALLEQQRELDPAKDAEWSEELERFRDLLETDLSDEERKLYQKLSNEPNRSVKELAQELGISEGQLRRRIKALKTKIQRAFGMIP